MTPKPHPLEEAAKVMMAAVKAVHDSSEAAAARLKVFQGLVECNASGAEIEIARTNAIAAFEAHLDNFLKGRAARATFDMALQRMKHGG